jgi:hypothetical protein
MIVVKPSNTNHIVKLIPRFYPLGEIVVELFNEVTKVTETIENVYLIVDGNLFLDFDYTFTEQQKFQLKIYDTEGVIFRGKVLATEQIPQDFEQTKDIYTYYE